MLLARQMGRPLAFLEIRELLENVRIRVPRLYAARPELGLLVVEDLGETLGERLARAPEERDLLYGRAVRELARAQRALAELPADSVVRTRSFDRRLLGGEVQHFREWGVEALGTALSESEKAMFERAAEYLVETIVGFGQGFVHRDYQSRNLLVPGGAVAWIDFQDALLGPRAYDLVALLHDSYQQFDDAFVTARLRDFVEAQGLSESEAQALRFEFDVITVQRKLKDAGRFVFFDRTRGDSSYLQYFVPSLDKVRGALARLAGHGELDALADLVERQIEIGRGRGMLPA
jgi:N-acetylmuramate 1-kinase